MAFIETIEDCNTQNQMQWVFEEYNNFEPKRYAQLAINKLKNLTNNQKNNLQKLINDNIDIEGRTGWNAYCHILSINQINHVGW